MKVNTLVKFIFNNKNEQKNLKYYTEHAHIIINVWLKNINRYLGNIHKFLVHKITSFLACTGYT